MADNSLRSYRNRDAGARREADRETAGDPLAELARLIGQSDPLGDFSRNARHGTAETLDDVEPASTLDWAAADQYAEQNHHPEERYDPPRLADSYQPLPEPAYAPRDRDFRDEGGRDVARGYEPLPPASRDNHMRFLPPEPQDDRYQADDQYQAGEEQRDYAEDESYPAQDYDDDAPPRRRSGAVLIAAVLGLAVLGTAGAFAYRNMFGSSMLPSLPPIIKASDGPNKIVPNNVAAQSGMSTQANATGSNEKLVSHDEQPVDVQQLVKPAPRVISTIPVYPDPNSASSGPQVATATAPVVASPGPPVSAAPVPLPAPAPSASVMPVPEPKKIHTVTIRPDQMGALNAAPAPSAPSARTAITRPSAPRTIAAPPPPPGANAPLAIVPSQGEAPSSAAIRARTAMARASTAAPTPAPETAPASGGGYDVQVSSQRSDADAHAAFHSLQAKFPDQLGGRQPIVRRADLGAKGIYFRTLVGPFASMEQAAGLCSSLKAAGGSCIVQRN